jgi:hypothetical protein
VPVRVLKVGTGGWCLWWQTVLRLNMHGALFATSKLLAGGLNNAHIDRSQYAPTTSTATMTNAFYLGPLRRELGWQTHDHARSHQSLF